MAVESAADRAAFLDPEEFAHTVTVTPANGDPVRQFSALFDPEGAIVELSDGLRAATVRPQLFGLAEDLEALVEGDSLTVSVPSPTGLVEIGTYSVSDPATADGTGFATLNLVRPWS